MLKKVKYGLHTFLMKFKKARVGILPQSSLLIMIQGGTMITKPPLGLTGFAWQVSKGV